MNVLVTGAAGFIGSHLADRLCGLGLHVRVVDNLRTGRLENLSTVMDRVEWMHADLTEPGVCAAATAGIDVVFHEAAIPSVPRSHAEPELTHRANVDATLLLLEASRKAGVRRVVYAASSSVYGDADESPKHEGLPARPRSLYAVQKHLGELYGRVYTEAFGLEVVPMRYFNVYGPRQDPSSEYSAVIPKFLQMMRRGQRPTIYGDGETSRDFTYIEDVVEANVLAMTATQAAGQCLNIAAGQSISLNELVGRINRLLGTELAPQYLPERQGDVRHSLADVRLAGRILGYRPRIGLDEGLRRTAASLVP